MQLLIEQILKGQERLEKKVDDCKEDIGKIKEDLRDGSGTHRAIQDWQKGHDVYHAKKDEEAKAGPHWLIRSAGTAAAGAIGVAAMWFVLRGLVDNGPAHVTRTEETKKTVTKDPG